jgi:hypothetical protein
MHRLDRAYNKSAAIKQYAYKKIPSSFLNALLVDVIPILPYGARKLCV